jgi:hypothetical protein
MATMTERVQERGTMSEHIETPSTIYEPWTDGYAVGFKVTRKADGKVGYIYLNPSYDDTMADEESSPDVFVYTGPDGDPNAGVDAPAHYYAMDEDVFGHA